MGNMATNPRGRGGEVRVECVQDLRSASGACDADVTVTPVHCAAVRGHGEDGFVCVAVMSVLFPVAPLLTMALCGCVRVVTPTARRRLWQRRFTITTSTGRGGGRRTGVGRASAIGGAGVAV